MAAATRQRRRTAETSFEPLDFHGVLPRSRGVAIDARKGLKIRLSNRPGVLRRPPHTGHQVRSCRLPDIGHTCPWSVSPGLDREACRLSNTWSAGRQARGPERARAPLERPAGGDIEHQARAKGLAVRVQEEPEATRQAASHQAAADPPRIPCSSNGRTPAFTPRKSGSIPGMGSPPFRDRQRRTLLRACLYGL